MASRTRPAVGSRTVSGALSVRETVATDTRARSATSLIEGRPMAEEMKTITS